MPFQDTSALQLAEGFAAYAGTWARECNADSVAREWVPRLAKQLSLAVSAGHVCLPLEAIEEEGLPPPETLRTILLDSGLTGTPENPENYPLLLDAENRLYLHRYFAYERRLAEHLVALHNNHSPALSTDTARHTLNRFFGEADPANADWQRIAAALAMRQPLTIISGGPGTGKTTTVARILACLLKQNPATRIALAAPTGKAAMRMLEAIREQAVSFPAGLQHQLPAEAFTLHRLLGVTARPGVFRHNSANPLALDTLVVDEASMIDLAMASRLFDALPQHARLILLGDKDQLPAVEAGAVFSELSTNPALSPDCLADLASITGIAPNAITPPDAAPGAMKDSTIWLTKNFRFAADSGIGCLALAIRDGNMETAKTALEKTKDGSLTWLSGTNTTLEGKAATRLLEGYDAYLTAIATHPEDTQAVFDAFERFRVLCATQEGGLGVSAVNSLMTARLKSRLAIASKGEWYIGRPVMVLRNDYGLRLFNGDIGITLPGPDGRLMVHFPSETEGFQTISPLRLPEHETAFAMTVHKSQGSEFESLMILTPSRPNPVVTRELLYTAITRARKTATLVCSEETLENGIRTSIKKHTGLLARMREADA
ncbi:MAG: exodeoxyribonuclease V subunit alpha [Burkholderiaceae bacterium]|jgi:exodeoxyribonuclease V alpha subunit|nr:exodeoxyribonuclease V subunit alpha [Burkholderiaceae bacterium]